MVDIYLMECPFEGHKPVGTTLIPSVGGCDISCRRVGPGQCAAEDFIDFLNVFRWYVWTKIFRQGTGIGDIHSRLPI